MLDNVKKIFVLSDTQKPLTPYLKLSLTVFCYIPERKQESLVACFSAQSDFIGFVQTSNKPNPTIIFIPKQQKWKLTASHHRPVIFKTLKWRHSLIHEDKYPQS